MNRRRANAKSDVIAACFGLARTVFERHVARSSRFPPGRNNAALGRGTVSYLLHRTIAVAGPAATMTQTLVIAAQRCKARIVDFAAQQLLLSFGWQRTVESQLHSKG
jgi:hypothetical protein